MATTVEIASLRASLIPILQQYGLEEEYHKNLYAAPYSPFEEYGKWQQLKGRQLGVAKIIEMLDELAAKP